VRYEAEHSEKHIQFPSTQFLREIFVDHSGHQAKDNKGVHCARNFLGRRVDEFALAAQGSQKLDGIFPIFSFGFG
jgi:hypothetical protein